MDRTAAVAIALSLTLPAAVSADWPQWRGPRGTGVSDERNRRRADLPPKR
jgi:hypothetical protein